MASTVDRDAPERGSRILNWPAREPILKGAPRFVSNLGECQGTYRRILAFFSKEEKDLFQEGSK